MRPGFAEFYKHLKNIKAQEAEASMFCIDFGIDFDDFLDLGTRIWGNAADFFNQDWQLWHAPAFFVAMVFFSNLQAPPSHH